MLFLLAAAILTLSTTGTCLAQTSLSDNSLPLITSYDIYGTNYIDKAIRFEGRVLDVFKDEMNPHYFFALVEDAYGKVYLAVNMRDQPAYRFDSLLGARISANGRCARKVVRNARPHLDRQIDLNSSDITILSPSNDDPFAAPLTIKTEDIPPEKLIGLGRRRMFGRVLAIRRSDTMLIQSEDSSISRIELRNPAPPQVGDTVEVVGNVETDLHHINLSRAVWRPAKPWNESENDATNITARLLLQDDNGRAVINRHFHGRKVRIRGIVRSLPVQDFPEKTFVIDCDGIPLSCAASALSDKTTSLEIGCLVEIDGICWMEIENWRPGAVFPMSRGYTLVLQSEDSLKIIARPPWWTPARLLAVLDLMMPELDGASATAAIKAELPQTKIVLFTTFPASDMIAKALENGAEGVIFKSAADTELIKAIRKVANGEKYISSDVAKLLASDPPIPPLSPRQRDILESMARGLSNAEIARQFNITPTVVREYSIALFQKIGAANRTEAVAIALRKHLL